MASLPIARRFSRAISERTVGIVCTDYDLGVAFLKVLRSDESMAEELRTKRGKRRVARLFQDSIEQMTSFGFLEPIDEVTPGSVYRLVGRSESSVEEMVCGIDPFAYISHFSAMAHHGLTDRLPKTVFYSSPQGSEWTSAAKQKMDRDLGDALTSLHALELPVLRRLLPSRLEGTQLSRHTSSHLGAYIRVRASALRYSSLGRTFLDMVRQPDLCGGMRHVVAVYKEHADTYARLILDEVMKNGRKIEQVRVGYLLDEVCGLDNARIDDLLAASQRGGSRKLDPSNEYDGLHFSEKWNLSINV